MINELSQLANVLENARIPTASWHRKYQTLPKASSKRPCIRILLRDDDTVWFSRVPDEDAAFLRKFGSNQGSFPAMNLAPLYRITDSGQKETLQKVLQGKQKAPPLEIIRQWCRESNWSDKFLRKYTNSLIHVPAEIQQSLAGHSELAILQLIRDAEPLKDPQVFHQKLQEAAFQMLARKEHTVLALQLLFHPGDGSQPARDDFGTLSVILDSSTLERRGTPSVGADFTEEFNAALQQAEQMKAAVVPAADEEDAFGQPYQPSDAPMPRVTLAGGFITSLRTMFRAHPCQFRYGRIGNDTYPLSQDMRMRLKSALEWVSDEQRREITWTNLSRDDILFVYPNRLPEGSASFVRLFRPSPNRSSLFEQEAKNFLELFRPKGQTSPAHPDRIQLLVLHKVDRGRTKLAYTQHVTPADIQRCSAQWAEGCRNLPRFRLTALPILFPAQTSEILNRTWKQDGSLLPDRSRPFPPYHGIQLFLDCQRQPLLELHVLVQSTVTLAAFAGWLMIAPPQQWESRAKQLAYLKQAIVLLALLLYRLDIRKENYMQNFPYLYGQLLKASDELHVLYCRTERKGEIPKQLAGSCCYAAATEAPLRTLAQLSLRMAPYMNWARSYQYQKVETENCESWRARWLLGVCEKVSAALSEAWTPSVRFCDEEKAQLFMGYLASLPKLSNTQPQTKNKEESEHDA